MRGEQGDRRSLRQGDGLAARRVPDGAGAVGLAQLDHPASVVERCREVDGEGASVAARAVDRGRPRRRGVDDEEVAGPQMHADVAKARMVQGLGRGDEEADGVARHPAELRRRGRRQLRGQAERGARDLDGAHPAPPATGSRSVAR
jgi:hypothetical protein